MIGIGGSGMCPLAEILHSKGHILTGSDNNESDPLSRVKALGIKVSMGHKAQNVHGADLVVYSAAISKDNPELVEAARLGIPTLERSHLLGSLTRRYDNVIGVSGTHGKTTTSSIITQIFVMANMDPTAVIGGKLPLINANGIAGNSEHMICESCEFVDTFLCLSPDIAVLLNIDNDHLDYFGSMERLCESFNKFVGMAHTAVINGDDPLCLEIANNFKGKCYTFGKKDTNDYVAKNIQPKGDGMEFDLYKKGEFQIKIKLGIPGEHNVYNALAAYVSADICGVNPSDCARAIESFSGAGRRFEKLGTYKGIAVADDYAHHPTELTATLTAAKNMGYNNVIAVFQPFTFSRTELLKDEFIKALSIADKVVLPPIMGSREINKTGISSNDLAKGLECAYVVDDFSGVVDTLLEIANEGDLVITMGGGDIYKAARMYIEKLK
ncbi:MAG: UDP-N-acetylmuramate--L-alanine ligase [Clostridia bacterium]|nr:UDP-N-acetylmuramate--L-alanine ligase [Clostridia bacterium]